MKPVYQPIMVMNSNTFTTISQYQQCLKETNHLTENA